MRSGFVQWLHDVTAITLGMGLGDYLSTNTTEPPIASVVLYYAQKLLTSSSIIMFLQIYFLLVPALTS